MIKFVKPSAQTVGSAEPINGILYLKIQKTYVLLHETVGSTDPTNGILDAAMPETSALLHETDGCKDPMNMCENVYFQDLHFGRPSITVSTVYMVIYAYMWLYIVIYGYTCLYIVF